MKKMKKWIEKVFHILGYRISRTNTNYCNYNNFENLSQAYEQLLNELKGEKIIIQDNVRPKLLARLQGTPPSEAYFIIESLIKTKYLNGDVCEFGVAQGETTSLIANEIKNTQKILHLFDSFKGLSKPTKKDQLINDIFSLGTMEAYTGTMSCPDIMVKERLEAISFPSNRYVIHKGFIEKLIQNDKNLPHSVSFAYIDFDLYEPTKIALEYLHDVTASGSIIVVDDYNFFSAGVKTAVDEFIKKKNSSGKIYDISIPDTRLGCFAILNKKG